MLMQFDCNNFCILGMCDCNGEVLNHVLSTLQGYKCFEKEKLARLGWQLYELARGKEVFDYVQNYAHSLVITSDFWTCSCKDNYIVHKDMQQCPMCGAVTDTCRCLCLERMLDQHMRALNIVDSYKYGMAVEQEIKGGV